MQLTATCEIGFVNQERVPMVFMLRPRSGAGQWVKAQSYTAQPEVAATDYVDIYGNFCQRVLAPQGQFQFSARATVRVPDDLDRAPSQSPTPIEALPDFTLAFLLPSRYCQSDLLGDMAAEIAGDAAPGYDQVETVRSWINANILYQPGSSNASTSAIETSRTRAGVCRDMAHLGIALTRALDIPARMAVGYKHGLEPMDLHAWFEAYIGAQWYTFDSKQPQTESERIVIAYGRDATDVALVTQFGASELTQLQVTVERA